MAVNYASMIEPLMMVRSSGPAGMNGLPGEDVGRVNRVEGGYIELISEDTDGGVRMIPLEWVDRVDGGTVYLSRDLETLRQQNQSR